MSFHLGDKRDMAVAGLVDEVERVLLEQLEDNHFYGHLFTALNKVRKEYDVGEWNLTMEKKGKS